MTIYEYYICARKEPKKEVTVICLLAGPNGLDLSSLVFVWSLYNDYITENLNNYANLDN